MTVYVVIRNAEIQDDSGFMGVYSTKNKAEKYVDFYKKEYSKGTYDEYEILECEVD